MHQQRNTLAVILINNALMTLGFGLWQAIFNNFAVEELGVRADQMGLTTRLRTPKPGPEPAVAAAPAKAS